MGISISKPSKFFAMHRITRFSFNLYYYLSSLIKHKLEYSVRERKKNDRKVKHEIYDCHFYIDVLQTMLPDVLPQKPYVCKRTPLICNNWLKVTCKWKGFWADVERSSEIIEKMKEALWIWIHWVAIY